MEESGIVGFTVTGAMEKVTDFRTAPFCSQAVFAQMLGLEDITEDVVRGWVETKTVPTAKIGRRRVINLHKIRRDLDRGKSIFCQRDYDDEWRPVLLPVQAAYAALSSAPRSSKLLKLLSAP